MSDKRINEVAAEAVPEVQQMEEVKSRLRAFRTANPDFFKYLDPLVEEYNTKLEAAEKAVRTRNVSCGDFHLYQQYIKWDVDALRTALGREGFLAIGGSETTITKYDVDKKRLEVAAKSGQIPQATLEASTKIERKYHKPNKILLP